MGRAQGADESSQAQGRLRRRGTTVFEDDRAVTVTDEAPDEERYSTIGLDALGRQLVVIYTVRAKRIRIISARRATRRERAEYEKQGL